MGSVSQKTASAPHTIVEGVEGKVCGAALKQRRINAYEPCGQWKPLNAFWQSSAYEDGFDVTCIECRKAQRRESYIPQRPRASVDPGKTQKCKVCLDDKPCTADFFPYHDRKTGKLRNVCRACVTGYSRGETTYATEVPVDRAIVPARTSTITVMDREFTVGWHEEAAYWPVKPFVEAAGMDWSAQSRRIDRDENLTVATLAIVAADGKQREMLCLPWGQWHYFWTGTHAPQAERFRREAAEALAVVFGDTASEVLSDVPVTERIQQKSASLPPVAVPSSDNVTDPYFSLLQHFHETGISARVLSQHFADANRFMDAIPAVAEQMRIYLEGLAPLAEAVKKRRNPLTHGWIYVLRDKVTRPARYKIGMTQNADPQKRQREVEGQWANGQSSQIVWIETDNIKLERAIHSYYKRRDKHTHLGEEWYRLSDDDVMRLTALMPFLRLSDFRSELLDHQVVVQTDLFMGDAESEE